MCGHAGQLKLARKEQGKEERDRHQLNKNAKKKMKIGAR